MRARYMALVVGFSLGLLLMGRGLTGGVISQSCCAPGSIGCDAASICPVYQEPQAVQEMNLLGFLLVIATIGVAGLEILHLRRIETFHRIPVPPPDESIDGPTHPYQHVLARQQGARPKGHSKKRTSR